MAPKSQGFASLDALFAAVRERCEEEYEEAFHEVWQGINDWPPFKTPSAFELRARDAYERLAAAVEAAREIVREADEARAEWIRHANTLPGNEILTAQPPDKAASSTAAKLASWVGAADHAAKERARGAKTEHGLVLLTDISVRPWTEGTLPNARLLAALHVLTRARYGFVPAPGAASDEELILGTTEIATDRQAAVVSLLHGNKPGSATPRWTVAKVIGEEAKAMRLVIARALPRLGEWMSRVCDGVTMPEMMKEPRSLEEAMFVSIAISKGAEIGASAFRLAERFQPEEARRLRDSDAGEALARMLEVAKVTDPRGHKQHDWSRVFVPPGAALSVRRVQTGRHVHRAQLAAARVPYSRRAAVSAGHPRAGAGGRRGDRLRPSTRPADPRARPRRGSQPRPPRARRRSAAPHGLPRGRPLTDHHGAP